MKKINPKQITIRQEAQEKMHDTWFGKGNKCPNRCSICIRMYGEKEIAK